MNRDRILKFEWSYEDYLAVTNREDNEQSANRWAEVINKIDNKHYESVDEEIRFTIKYVDEELLDEEE